MDWICEKPSIQETADLQQKTASADLTAEAVLIQANVNAS